MSYEICGHPAFGRQTTGRRQTITGEAEIQSFRTDGQPLKKANAIHDSDDTRRYVNYCVNYMLNSKRRKG